MTGRYLITLLVPASLIILSIPMILQLVPRNHWYGFRTPYTLSSDPVWYYSNKVSGVALLCAGIAWMLAGFVLSDVKTIVWSGMGILGAAILVSFIIVYRK